MNSKPSGGAVSAILDDEKDPVYGISITGS